MNYIIRALITRIKSSTLMQTVQAVLNDSDLKDDIEHLEPYGFTAHAPGGDERDGVVVCVDGDTSHSIMICIANRKFRLKNLKEGEVALYTDEGDKIHFKRGRQLLIETQQLQINASGGVNINSSFLQHNGVNIGASHMHSGDDDDGTTGPPV
jgi:phage baseplate assembly protein V